MFKQLVDEVYLYVVRDPLKHQDNANITCNIKDVKGIQPLNDSAQII